MADDTATEIQDRSIIVLIKENMIQDKKREEEYKSLLTDYISFLKEEIGEKNNIIRKHFDVICKEDNIETRPSQEKNVLTSRNVSNPNNISLITEESTNEHINEILISPGKENNHSNVNDIYRNYEKVDVFCGYQIENKWTTERRKNKNKRNVHSSPIIFESNNYINLLDNEKANSITPNYPDNEIIHEDIDTAISKHDIKQRVIKKVKSNETRVYTSQFPERNTLSKKRTEQNRSCNLK